jgi:hypothetical protein
MNLTNEAGISLPLAVWLLHDTYDYQVDANAISATTLMKPVRQTILRGRINPELVSTDLAEFIARTLGHSIHDSIERAWSSPEGRSNALKLMGYPDDVIQKVKVNPTDEEIHADPEIIAVYIEQRISVVYRGVRIHGKFDMVAEGTINDFKSTSAWAWAKGTRDEDFILQMSIYRWIDAQQEVPKITEDHGQINFIFTDWQKGMARSNPDYPQKRVETKQLKLMPLDEVQSWIDKKLDQIKQFGGQAEKLLPQCTKEELWMSDPQFKFYTDPAKAKDPSARSTKNFDDLGSAKLYQNEKGGKGVIVTVPGIPKRCEYCDVFDLCSQKDQWFK